MAVRLGACALLLVAAAIPAAATVIVAMDFDEQCAAADRVFVGTVRAVESRRIAAAPQYFETLVTFTSRRRWWERCRRVVLRFAGGEMGGVRQSIDGMPDLRAGERYVVFADADHEPPLLSPIVGFNQGSTALSARTSRWPAQRGARSCRAAVRRQHLRPSCSGRSRPEAMPRSPSLWTFSRPYGPHATDDQLRVVAHHRGDTRCIGSLP